MLPITCAYIFTAMAAASQGLRVHAHGCMKTWQLVYSRFCKKGSLYACKHCSNIHTESYLQAYIVNGAYWLLGFRSLILVKIENGVNSLFQVINGAQ